MKEPIIAAVVALVILIASVAIGWVVISCNGNPQRQICAASAETPAAPQEDCDAEDFRKREAECGFTDADRRATRKPTPPAPRQTRRR